MQKQHYEYYTPIIEWAEEKGILETGRLTKQLLKSSEEMPGVTNSDRKL